MRPRRVTSGNHDNRKVTFHGARKHSNQLDELQNIIDQQPETIVMKLAAPRFRLKDVLQRSSDEMTELLLGVIRKACQAVGNASNLSHIISQIISSGFLTGAVIRYTTKCRMDLLSSSDNKVLLTICDVLKACMERLPAASVQNVTAVLAQLKAIEETSETSRPQAQLRESLKELEEQHAVVLTQTQRGSLMKVKSPEVDHDDSAEPPVSFRQIPIEPTPEDLHDDVELFLRKNKVFGSYRDAEQYLDIQFRLLREDYVYPLRQGIRELRRAGEQHTYEKYIQDVRIYKDVRYIGPWCCTKGVVYHFMFDTSNLRNVMWENSKWLLYGSLVCLSSNDFSTFMVGTVLERDPKRLRKGMIDIFIHDSQQHLQLNPLTVYKMVECSAYFEAYRHNLECLQELDGTKLPFLDYLLGKRKGAGSPPRYLRGNIAKYDFTPSLKKSSSVKKRWKVLDKTKWKKASDFGLDESQHNALQMALTHEFSLIQGPPGTGKTFIALKIVQLLLHNFRFWGRRLLYPERVGSSPILLVCYTNHALDQFLEGILQLIPHSSGPVVRVGGRCSSDNEKVRRCQLSELKRDPAVRNNIPEELKDLTREITEQMMACERHVSYLTTGEINSSTRIIEDTRLLSMMTKHHRMCFEEMMQDSTRSFVREWLLASVMSRSEEVEEPSDDTEDRGGDFPDSLDDDITEEEARQAEQERMVNDGDDDENKKRLGDISKQALCQALNVSDDLAEEKNPEQWQSVLSPKRLKKIIRTELNKQEIMSEEEESTVSDVWQLPVAKRWSLYRLWRRRFVADCSYRMQESTNAYNQLAQRLQEIQQEEVYYMLRSARLIAMTTTGAAKHRHTLRRVKPPIVIVEEAAEVLEAHIITSLSEACEHLILIGDHQQLRPKPTVYKLAKQYHLDVSLFERMQLNNSPCARLETQHRMRPEIAELIVPHIYPHLFNDESVEKYDNIRGVGGNLFFINHGHSEMQTSDSKSRKNIHEAEYLSALCRYLILQGYEPSEVTILTTYTGQMFEIKKRTRKDEVTSNVRVTPVDNFQGEENNIILLSLVRSNEQGKAGFLKIANRICVALSRAKMGLFAIGNLQLMEESSDTWKSICSDLRAKNKIVNGLPLFCQNHPETRLCAVNSEDFSKAPNGGCTRPCEYRLNCGHVCGMLCHPSDPEHKQYKCQKPCVKTNCKLKHKCPKKCYEDCGKCMVLVEKTIPRCQHKLNIPCHMNPAEYKCTEPCEKNMACGHRCPNNCGDECLDHSKCQVVIPGREWPCGHLLDVECCKNENNYPCPSMVKRFLTCGHEVEIKCSADISKVKCMEKIRLVLCERKCENVVSCYLRDKFAEEGCQAVLQKQCAKNAEHVYSVKCREYEAASCIFSCNTKLKCGHKCQGQCGTCAKEGRHELCKAECSRILPCQHKCQGLCGEPCPPCTEQCNRSCPHGICRHQCAKPCTCTRPCMRGCPHSQCKRTCNEVCDEDPCGEPCPLNLSCGHRCPFNCGEPCASICPECRPPFYELVHRTLGISMNPNTQYVMLLPCRHVIPVHYMDKVASKYSDHICQVPREFKTFQCPLCQQRITYCARYQRLVVICSNELEAVKKTVMESYDIWKSLVKSNLGKKLHKQIQQLTDDRQDGLCHALRTCLGCVALLNEVRSYLENIQHAGRENANKKAVTVLRRCLNECDTELDLHIVEYSNGQIDVDSLSLRIQLLYMLAVLIHMETYIKNKRNVIDELVDNIMSISQLDEQSIMKRAIGRANRKLCQVIPKHLRNGIDDYRNELKKYLKGYVDLRVDKKWVLCSNGHAFSVPPNADVQTLHHHCPVCVTDEDTTSEEEEDD